MVCNSGKRWVVQSSEHVYLVRSYSRMQSISLIRSANELAVMGCYHCASRAVVPKVRASSLKVGFIAYLNR